MVSGITDTFSEVASILGEIRDNPENTFFILFDAVLQVLLSVIGFLLVGFHELSLQLLMYTPYPQSEEGNNVIFGTPTDGSIFDTMISFSSGFIEPLALLMIFIGIIFLLFIRVFDIVIQDFGINTQEGMKRLFIAPIIIILWLPLANLLLFFSYGMTEWMYTINLSDFTDGTGILDDSRGDRIKNDDGSLSISSYIDLFTRNEDINVAVGMYQAFIGLIFAAVGVFVSAILYLFVLFGAVIRLMGLLAYYAIAPIGIVLWAFKWRGFAEMGGRIVRYFVLLALFPIGVAFINLMAPPIFLASLAVGEDVIDDLFVSVNDPMAEGENELINFTDVLSVEEMYAFIFIILTPILIGIVPWGIVIGFDKAMKAAGVAAGASVLAAGAVATGGAGLATLGAAKGSFAGATMAKSAAASGISRGVGRAKTEAKAFHRATNEERVKMASAYGGAAKSGFKSTVGSIRQKGDSVRQGYMDGLGNLDDNVDRVTGRMASAVNNPKETFKNASDKIGTGAWERANKGYEFSTRQYGSVKKRMAGGYSRAKFMSQRLTPDDVNGFRDLEDKFAESSWIKKYGGSRARMLQKGASMHRSFEKGAKSGLEELKVANDEYKDADIDGIGGSWFEPRDPDDGLSGIKDEEKMMTEAERRTLGQKLVENDKLVGEVAATTGMDEDKITAEVMSNKLLGHMHDPDKEVKDMFGSFSDEAKDTFKDISVDEIQETIQSEDDLRAFYDDNTQAVRQVQQDRYSDDDTDTLLEREFKSKLYSKEEAYIEDVNKDISSHIAGTLEQLSPSDIQGIRGIPDLNLSNKSADVFAQNIADEIAETDGSRQEIGNALARNNDVEDLNKNQLKDLVDTIHSSLDQSTRQINGALDVNLNGEEIIQESQKAVQADTISVRELEGSSGNGAERFAERTAEINSGNVSVDELRSFMQNAEFVVDGTDGPEIHNASDMMQNAIQQVAEKYDLENSDYRDEIMNNDKLLEQVIHDMDKGVIDDEYNLIKAFRDTMEYANDKGNSNEDLPDVEQTVERIIKLDGTEMMGVDESRIDNLERGLEGQIKQNQQNLMQALNNKESKQAVRDYQNSNDSLNNIIRGLNDNERKTVIQELDGLNFGDL